jgi:Tol biopolymer transport system component
LRLTEHEAYEARPAWSPDGRQIALVRVLEEGESATDAIYIVPSLGGQERKLTEVEGPVEASFYLLPSLSWSPDGRWLAFVEKTAVGEPARIVRLSLDTLEKQPLTSPPKQTFGDLLPEVSPDGSLLAFVRSGAGEDVGANNQDVWVQPVEG